MKSLQADIISKKLKHEYIFVGPEIGIMDIYLQQMSKALNQKITRLDSVQDIFKKSSSSIVKTSTFFVVRDDKNYIKDEKAWDKVTGYCKANNFNLVLVFTTMDKRSKFYKNFSVSFIEFEKLNPQMLSKYIDKALPGLKEDERVTLAEVCDCDYNRIMLECDKVRAFYSCNDVTCSQALTHLLKVGVIHQPIGDITFKLTDAILTRNVNDSLEYSRQAKLKQEPEVMVMSILYNGFRQILMVQGLGTDQSEPVKRTGLTAWQVKMAKEKQGHYSIGELIENLKVIRDVEKGIKTGTIEPSLAIDYVIAKLM